MYKEKKLSGIHSGILLKLSISDGGRDFSGWELRLEKADLHYLGKVNRTLVFADSYSKVMFLHMVRHTPLKFEDLVASISLLDDQENKLRDTEMVG
ncbi:hypothetical protein Dsin_004942 [Dipteronia sinensis]|uniref:Uncharacterized protein n=1 Tax=Dipteronia sinensis TaxID=43782 RepID=A0AAE0AWF2_9ROSI|nr:hypothetical protein Dsin_004942 [Dipteronia sinensis]